MSPSVGQNCAICRFLVSLGVKQTDFKLNFTNYCHTGTEKADHDSDKCFFVKYHVQMSVLRRGVLLFGIKKIFALLVISSVQCYAR